MFRREEIHVVVVGGETNGYWRIMGAQLPEDRLGRRLALTRGITPDHGDIGGLAAGAAGAISPPAVEVEIASYDSTVTR